MAEGVTLALGTPLSLRTPRLVARGASLSTEVSLGGPTSGNHAGGDVTAQAGTPTNLPSERCPMGIPQARPLGQGSYGGTRQKLVTPSRVTAPQGGQCLW